MKKIPKLHTAVFDCETDGLLHQMTRIHCLNIRDFENGTVYVFRHNSKENTIWEGVQMLLEADFVVGQNILHFDIPALELIFGPLDFKGKIRDTLVLTRVIFSDQKDKDFRLHEKGLLPGKCIGGNRLEDWGHRLGLQKGEYSDERKAKAKELGIKDPEQIHRFVWGTWNQEMEEYCGLDVTVTTALWDLICDRGLTQTALILEHRIHDIMGEQERNGWYFDVEEGTKLAESLNKEMDMLIEIAKDHYGQWWVPQRKMQTRPLWDASKGTIKRGAKTKKGQKVTVKTFYTPRPELGETDENRGVWADIVIPTKTINYKSKPMLSRMEGVPFCPIKKLEFNPSSRAHVIDRFTTVYDWEPTEFTEAKNPSIDDTVLKSLAGKIPMAAELADIFYYKKRLGQVEVGDNAWLKLVDGNKLLHHYCNVGGTVTGRASHIGPNLAQVPRVVIKTITDPETGQKRKALLKGKEGLHGWDCRKLFIVPDTHIMVGSDLEGIELRCLAELLAPFDGGEYIDVILNQDIHSYNQAAANLDSRDKSKTFIYALVYGAGDVKLGSIVDEFASEDEQMRLGAMLRTKFLANLKGFKEVMKMVRNWSRKGFVPGLDGRLVPVRSEHAALNSKLQSDAALIAKKWIVNYYDYLHLEGLECGWDKDFVFLGWIHDENQSACLPWHAELMKATSLRAAADAGKFFNFRIPVAAAAKHGWNWAETH